MHSPIHIKPSLSRIVGSLSLGLYLAATSQGGDNPLLTELLDTGVQITEDGAIKLPPPTLRDGMSASEQRKAVESVAGTRYTWDALIRKSVVAPFVLKTKFDHPLVDVARQVDLWFVAYGDLRKLQSEEFLMNQFASSEAEDGVIRSHVLTNDELQERGIALYHHPDDPSFVAAELSLMERVRIKATTTTITTNSLDSVLAVSKLAADFDRDPEFPNQWHSLGRDSNGKQSVGPPHSYSGLGSYVKATRLQEPQDAIFIEYHLAFAEPANWFNGTNLLRSKLPLVAQNMVRKMRRSLGTR